MSDPLADLEAMLQDLFTDHNVAEQDWWCGPVRDESEFPTFARFSAEWLRANRDRVTLLLYADDRDAALRAFGGKPDTIVSDFVSDRKWAEWLFPLEEDQ